MHFKIVSKYFCDFPTKSSNLKNLCGLSKLSFPPLYIFGMYVLPSCARRRHPHYVALHGSIRNKLMPSNYADVYDEKGRKEGKGSNSLSSHHHTQLDKSHNILQTKEVYVKLSGFIVVLYSSSDMVQCQYVFWYNIRQGRRFEKKPTRSTYPRVGYIYYYGTLFLGAKIFMWHFLLYDLKHMFKNPLVGPWYRKFFERKINFEWFTAILGCSCTTP